MFGGKVGGKAKAAIAAVKEKVAAKRKLKQRRGAAIKRGEEGISTELFSKVIWELKKQSSGRPGEEAEGRKIKTIRRLLIKNTLDAFGILNTPADPTKRQRIQKIMERMGNRAYLLKAVGKKRGTKDGVMEKGITDLRSELGGKEKVRQFLLKFESARAETSKRLKSLKE